LNGLLIKFVPYVVSPVSYELSKKFPKWGYCFTSRQLLTFYTNNSVNNEDLKEERRKENNTFFSEIKEPPPIKAVSETI